MNDPVIVPIVRVSERPSQELPLYVTEGASGMDVRASLDEPLVLAAGDRSAVPTGLAVAVPRGWEIQVRPRSGLAIHHGVTVVNAPGTIDADYRGEIRVLLVNLGRRPYTIGHGDRIAQLVLCPVGRMRWDPMETLDETKRGSGGFGSTGKR